jgi:hypothetical protein
MPLNQASQRSRAARAGFGVWSTPRDTFARKRRGGEKEMLLAHVTPIAPEFARLAAFYLDLPLPDQTHEDDLTDL